MIYFPLLKLSALISKLYSSIFFAWFSEQYSSVLYNFCSKNVVITEQGQLQQRW